MDKDQWIVVDLGTKETTISYEDWVKLGLLEILRGGC